MSNWITHANHQNVVAMLLKTIKAAKLTASIQGVEYLTGLRKAVAEVQGRPVVNVKTYKTINLDPAIFTIDNKTTLRCNDDIEFNNLPECRVDRIVFEADGMELFFMDSGSDSMRIDPGCNLTINAGKLLSLD